MNIEELREHCLTVKGATESLPFLHHNIIVFKVMSKIFAMAPLEPKDGIFWVDLKCNPEYSEKLRESYAGINAGHVKTTMLWNRIILESDVPDRLIGELITHSVEEVLKNLSKTKKQEYKKLLQAELPSTEKPLSEMTNEELWQLFPIILSKYNPLWPEQFKKEKTAIEKTISKKNITRINHIGSTAIPGLIAKPTIDILLEIKTGTNLDKLIDSIGKTGYIHTPQPQKPAPHIMFMKGYTPQGFKRQVFHLHLRYPGDWDELYFRDYLISHPEIAEEYGKLKCKLAPVFRNNRDGYTEAKGEFIKKINKLAKEKFSGKYTPQK